MAPAPTILFLFLYIALIWLLVQATSVTKTGCPDKCGDVTISYPFGISGNDGCYRDNFDITCSDDNPPKVFWGENLEVLEINITSAEARVLNYIGYVCYNGTDQKQNSSNDTSTNLISGVRIRSITPEKELSPFLFSNRRNLFTVIGCYASAYIVGQGDSSYQSGCVSFCEGLNSTTGDGGSCNGLGCCQTSIPENLHYYNVQWGFNESKSWQYNPCSYAALMEIDWYNFTVQDLKGFQFYEQNYQGVPVVIDWAIRENGTCLESHVVNGTNGACKSNNSGCDNTTNGEGYICKCLPGYSGNPYLAHGCIDIDECQSPDVYPCLGTCRNIEGDYECTCPKGTEGNGKAKNCNKIPEKFPYPARVAIYSIGGVAIFVGLCFLIVAHRQHRKYMKGKEEYQRYYEMMKNHLRVFSKKHIEIATDNYNESHLLGRGGQGNVYRGLLENNQIVAIKKAKEIEQTKRGEFINEIILLSQLNHKNIVRLLGCCLEVQIPMLVYEFVPNGSLFELLHRNSSRRPISLGVRLKIALESAMALDYLHSSISSSIIHGDFKSANILLDADYTAKVSDFGASSVVPVNEIVELVHFSPGYLDPESLYTQLITKYSDVYSFGVVMLEIVTRKKAIYVDENGEKQPLATCFLSKARKNEHHEMLDGEIRANDENFMEILDEICEIAVQCLSPKGEDRPTMRQVAEELQKLVRYYNRSPNWQDDQGDTGILFDETNIPSISNASVFINMPAQNIAVGRELDSLHLKEFGKGGLSKRRMGQISLTQEGSFGSEELRNSPHSFNSTEGHIQRMILKSGSPKVLMEKSSPQAKKEAKTLE